MIALKVEKIGDQVVVILNDEAQEVLGAQPGSVVQVAAAVPEAWVDDHHARGRAFLKRYNRTFERLES